MAERTGLEPATPGVTGRYSNQLNYRSRTRIWWVLQGSNLRPTACKAVALPTELNTRYLARRAMLPRPKNLSNEASAWVRARPKGLPSGGVRAKGQSR